MLRKENTGGTAESYSPAAISEAKRLIREKAWSNEIALKSNVSLSSLSGVSVIIHDTPTQETVYYCTGCYTDSCAHCIIARTYHEDGMHASDRSVAAIEEDIRLFFSKAVERYERIIQTEGGLEGEFDEDFAKYESAYGIASMVWNKIFHDVGDIGLTVSLADRLVDKMEGYHYWNAVWNAIRDIRELVRCRLAELPAERYMELMMNTRSKWMLFFMPAYEKEEKENIVVRLTDSGMDVDDLKEICPNLFIND
ncbi:MAG: hypothetical protein FWG58_04480 [Methanomassiliicoccaceae archaeon]|nr:hypothetical protein [Methanomassiliicoccaceae archaeon]